MLWRHRNHRRIIITMHAPLINAIINDAVLHSNSHIKQMPPQIINILCFCGKLAAPDFVIKCTVLRPGLFGGQKSGSSTGLLHYCTLRLEEQMMHRMSA